MYVCVRMYANVCVRMYVCIGMYKYAYMYVYILYVFSVYVQSHPFGCVSGCSEGMVCCWNTIRGTCVHVFEDHEDSVLKVACTPTHVISLGADKTVRAWDRMDGTPLSVISLVSCTLWLCCCCYCCCCCCCYCLLCLCF